jgi:hypothetical protein
MNLIFINTILIIFTLLVLFTKSWFIFFPNNLFYGILFFSFISIPFVYKINLYLYLDKFKYFLYFLIFATILFFPVRNLNMGDGILLLTNFTIENLAFGYHLTMDELLEGLLHSFVYSNLYSLNSEIIDPRITYRILSTLAGFFFILLTHFYYKQWRFRFVSYLITFTSGGMFLFYGYSENYTIVSLVLWLFILFNVDNFKNNRSGFIYIFYNCILASLLILLHLVSGYLLFSLIFISYHYSSKNDFIKNSFFATLICLLFLLPVFIYFLFFSSVRIDLTQTHLTNPKFYPITKIISINHFRDILYCLLANAFIPVVYILYSYLRDKQNFLEFLNFKEVQFVLFVILGFSIHGFVHFPQLGFPADWDLMSFFWLPILLFSILLVEKNTKFELVPLLIFNILIFIFNMYQNSIPDLKKENDLNNSLKLVKNYFESDSNFKNIDPKYKKFYLKADFFLFESKGKLKQVEENDKILNLLKQNQEFKKELELSISNVDKNWLKSFYKRMTEYHLEYLNLIKQE